MNEITEEKVQKYFQVTGNAIAIVQRYNTEKIADDEKLHDLFDMIQRYYSDAKHFHAKNDLINAFAALNYAHGWLDCAARLKLFDVKGNNILFTVDEQE